MVRARIKVRGDPSRKTFRFVELTNAQEPRVSRLVVEGHEVDTVEVVLHGGVFSPRNMEDLIPITRHQVPSGECCLKQTLQPLLGCYDTHLPPTPPSRHHHSVRANIVQED